MTSAEILRQLSLPQPEFPVTVLHEAATAQRAALWPTLLDSLKRCNETPYEITDDDFHLSCHAFYLGNLWKEPSLLPELIGLLEAGRDDPEWMDDFFGEVGHDMVPVMLATTFEGRFEQFRSLLLHDRSRYWMVSDWVARAVLSLWATDKLTYEEAIAFFRGVVNEPSFWNDMEAASWVLLDTMEINPAPFLEAYGRSTAWQRKNLKVTIFSPETVKENLQGLPAQRKAMTLTNHQASLATWKEWIDSLSDAPEPPDEENPDEEPGELTDISAARFPTANTPKPAKAAPKVSPNDPCPCGSGRKFKKCCGV